MPAQINSNTPVAVTGAATGLTCNTTYHYKITAVNSAGTSTGIDQSFTTSACAPTVNPPTAVTGNATNIAANGATLNGMVNSKGADTTVIFEFGPTTDYGMNINANPNTLAATDPNVIVTANLTGLACQTKYNYRIKATNSADIGYGDNKELTTADCPPVDNNKHARALIIGGKTDANDILHDDIPLTMIQALLSLEAQGYSIGNHNLQVLWNGVAPNRPDGTILHPFITCDSLNV